MSTTNDESQKTTNTEDVTTITNVESHMTVDTGSGTEINVQERKNKTIKAKSKPYVLINIFIIDLPPFGMLRDIPVLLVLLRTVKTDSFRVQTRTNSDSLCRTIPTICIRSTRA